MAGIYPAEIQLLPMFHSYIRSRKEAFEYVRKFSQGEGSFLIRPNEKNDPSFVSLTINVGHGEICHCRVLINDLRGKPSYNITENLIFGSFIELLQYYREHRIHCIQNIDNVRLLQPLLVNRPASWHQERQEPARFSQQDLTCGQVVIGSNLGLQTNNVDTNVPPTSFIPSNPGLIIRPVNPSNNFSALVNGPRRDRTQSSQQYFPSQNREKSARQAASLYPQCSTSDIHSHQPQPLCMKQNRSQSESQIHQGIFYGQPGKPEASKHSKDQAAYWICKPPAPLPLRLDKEDDVYYTGIIPNKDYLQQMITYLKDTDMCECGLRQVDSQLPLGWAIHRSEEEDTYHRIFYQKDEETTTWEMPPEILHLMSQQQLDIILFLCQDGDWPVPKCLRKYIEMMEGNRNLSTRRSAPLSSSIASSSHSSSSSSTNSMITTGLRLSKQVTFSDARTKPVNTQMRSQQRLSGENYQETGCGTYERSRELVEKTKTSLVTVAVDSVAIQRPRKGEDILLSSGQPVLQRPPNIAKRMSPQLIIPCVETNTSPELQQLNHQQREKLLQLQQQQHHRQLSQQQHRQLSQQQHF